MSSQITFSSVQAAERNATKALQAFMSPFLSPLEREHAAHDLQMYSERVRTALDSMDRITLANYRDFKLSH